MAPPFAIKVIDMNVVSFDQSTTCSGWSLFVDGKYVKSGFIDKHKIKDADERIAEMGLALCRIIKEYKPDLIHFQNVEKWLLLHFCFLLEVEDTLRGRDDPQG